MTGVMITFNGKDTAQGREYGFSVNTAQETLAKGPDVDMPLRPSDPLFDTLTQMVSDPDQDTPHLMAAGEALHALLGTHGNTLGAFQPVMQSPPGTPGRDIRLCIPAYAAEMRNMPWETLYDPGTGFIDNDVGISILRSVEAKANATRPPAMLPAEGLQIVSVIAADGIDGFDEYRALLKALEAYDKPWVLHVFSPDASVKDAIAQGAAANITHHTVPASAPELMTKITQIAPQVCHFFCHGIASEAGAASLELSTMLSDMGRATTLVKPFQLSGALPSSCWLVLLNACNSGQAAGDSGSLAGELVEHGVPVVVGMREPTQSKTLHTFTKGFLNTALPVISQMLDQNAPVDLQLGPSLTAARNAICAEFRRPGADAAKRVKDWSLPVMVVSEQGFMIEAGSAGNPALIAELEGQRITLASFLSRMGAQLSDRQRQMIADQIAALDQTILEQLA